MILFSVNVSVMKEEGTHSLAYPEGGRWDFMRKLHFWQYLGPPSQLNPNQIDCLKCVSSTFSW